MNTKRSTQISFSQVEYDLLMIGSSLAQQFVHSPRQTQISEIFNSHITRNFLYLPNNHSFDNNSFHITINVSRLDYDVYMYISVTKSRSHHNKVVMLAFKTKISISI